MTSSLRNWSTCFHQFLHLVQIPSSSSPPENFLFWALLLFKVQLCLPKWSIDLTQSHYFTVPFLSILMISHELTSPLKTKCMCLSSLICIHWLWNRAWPKTVLSELNHCIKLMVLALLTLESTQRPFETHKTSKNLRLIDLPIWPHNVNFQATMGNFTFCRVLKPWKQTQLSHDLGSYSSWSYFSPEDKLWFSCIFCASGVLAFFCCIAMCLL